MKHKGSVVMLLFGSMLFAETALADESTGEGPASSTTWFSGSTLRLRDVAEFPTWGQYTEHIGALRRHARSPTKSQVQEFARLQPCACKLQQVLVEMPHRTSYFFELPSSRGGEQALLTVWRYKQDGASVDSGRARSNVK